MFLFRNKNKLAEANKQIESLRSQLADTQASEAHLRHLLKLKNEENSELHSFISHLKEQAHQTDSIKQKIAENHKLIESLNKQKIAMQHQIERLTMERDEAKAMIEARGITQSLTQSIDFLSVPVELPPPPQHKKIHKQKNPQKIADETDDSSEWYSSLSEPSIE